MIQECKRIRPYDLEALPSKSYSLQCLKITKDARDIPVAFSLQQIQGLHLKVCLIYRPSGPTPENTILFPAGGAVEPS